MSDSKTPIYDYVQKHGTSELMAVLSRENHAHLHNPNGSGIHPEFERSVYGAVAAINKAGQIGSKVGDKLFKPDRSQEVFLDIGLVVVREYCNVMREISPKDDHSYEYTDLKQNVHDVFIQRTIHRVSEHFHRNGFANIHDLTFKDHGDCKTLHDVICMFYKVRQCK